MTREEALAELKDTIKGSYYQCRMETYEMAIEAWNRRYGDGMDKREGKTAGERHARIGVLQRPLHPRCEVEMGG